MLAVVQKQLEEQKGDHKIKHDINTVPETPQQELDVASGLEKTSPPEPTVSEPALKSYASRSSAPNKRTLLVLKPVRTAASSPAINKPDPQNITLEPTCGGTLPKTPFSALFKSSNPTTPSSSAKAVHSTNKPKAILNRWGGDYSGKGHNQMRPDDENHTPTPTPPVSAPAWKPAPKKSAESVYSGLFSKTVSTDLDELESTGAWKPKHRFGKAKRS